LRTTRFGNGAEKVRKITVTKPDAMAARKKDKEENETLDDLQQNEVERGSIQPLLKTNSEAAERCSSEPPMCYGDLMRGGQMELRTENCEPFQPRPLRPRVVFKPCGVFNPARADCMEPCAS
jgi:hypothetical protein